MKDQKTLIRDKNSGGTIYNLVPKNYVGDCKVMDNETKKVLAILCSKEAAYISASHAVSPFCGYSEVLVEPFFQ